MYICFLNLTEMRIWTMLCKCVVCMCVSCTHAYDTFTAVIIHLWNSLFRYINHSKITPGNFHPGDCVGVANCNISVLVFIISDSSVGTVISRPAKIRYFSCCALRCVHVCVITDDRTVKTVVFKEQRKFLIIEKHITKIDNEDKMKTEEKIKKTN